MWIHAKQVWHVRMCVSVNVGSGLQQLWPSLAGSEMLSIHVSDPSVSLAVDVQFNTVLNSGKAEQSIPPGVLLLSGGAPVRPCSSMDILPGLNLNFSSRLRRLQLSYSVISSQKESSKRTACPLADPSVLWTHILTSSCPCDGVVILSLLSCPLQLKDVSP